VTGVQTCALPIYEYKPITSIIVGYKENAETNVPERKTENIVFIK
jgi:hypothetical protein